MGPAVARGILAGGGRSLRIETSDRWASCAAGLRHVDLHTWEDPSLWRTKLNDFISIERATRHVLPCGMYSPDTRHLAPSNAVNTLIVSHWSATASYSAASSRRMRRQSSLVIKAEVVRNSSARSRQRFASLADILGNPKRAHRPLKMALRLLVTGLAAYADPEQV